MTGGAATAPTADAILTLDGTAATSPELAGRKAATLARLRRAGLPVPPGVVLPVSIGVAPGLAARVAAELGHGPVAVRSSSPEEDGELSSAAGRYRTVLHVAVDDESLAESVAAVRDSASGAPMAVLIQPMIVADAAGVAFGADPVTGDRDTILVNAVAGLADKLVDGSATPARWTVADHAATCHTTNAPVLTAPQVLDIADLAATLGRLERGPQDIEWAIAQGTLHVLQSRPITALPTAPDTALPAGTWVHDTARYPNGMTPFAMSLAATEVSRGLTATFDRCGGLIEHVEMRGVAGHPYLRFTPVGGRGGGPPPALVLGLLCRLHPALRRRCRRARRLLESGELIADIDRWETVDRPAMQAAAADLRDVDPAALDDDALADHLDRTQALVRRGLAIHFHLMAAHLLGVYRLIDSCGRVLGWSRAEAMALVAGLSPASSDPSRQLRAVAAAIADHAAARSALLGADPDAGVPGPADDAADADGGGEGGLGDAVARLAAADPAGAAAFDHWCRIYGLRTANDDPGSPTLLEIPGFVQRLLIDEVRRCAAAPTVPPAGAGPGATEALRRARELLAARPAGDRREFEGALQQAARAYPVREDNVLWALSVPTGLTRRAAMAAGSRLCARGQIDIPDDVVMLDLDTVLAALRVGARTPRLRHEIARAKAERAWVAAHPLPDHYGPAPAPRPALTHLPRAARMVNEALQLDAPDDPPVDAPDDARDDAPRPARTAAAVPGTMIRSATAAPRPPAGALLAGVPASAGRYTGPVRIVRGPDGFASLRRGDVLVCPTTDPAWSLLFGLAGALVTDGGGVLTHAAIIAREHGIPAVVGTRCATSDLADGQWVTVDGTTGTVTAGGVPPPPP